MKARLVKLFFCVTLAMFPFFVSAQELLVKFRIEDEKGQSLKNAFVRLVGNKNLLKEIKTGENGLCSFNLNLGAEYNIVVSAKGFDGRVIQVSTIVPANQKGLMQEFPQIKIQLDPDSKGGNFEYSTVAEIYFNTPKGSFSYKSSSAKKTKDLNIQKMYFSDAPVEKTEEAEKNIEEPPKPTKETEVKNQSASELNALQKAEEQKAAEKQKLENEARELKQSSPVNTEKTAAEEISIQKEENIKPGNEQELLQKKSADAQIDVAIKAGMETKSGREKKNKTESDRQREINSNRTAKYEKNSSFSNMMRTVSESENSKTPKK